jgi:hypothetical protein
MKLKILLITALLLLTTLYSCKEKSTTPPDTMLVKITGQVLERKQSMYNGVKGAQVKLTGNGVDYLDSTDTDGKFYFQFSPDTIIRVTLSVKKDGYRSVPDWSFPAEIGTQYDHTFTIELDTTTTIGGGGGGGVDPTSGMPQSIYFIGPQTIDLKVYGVGGIETAIILYEVRDSLGFPITFSQRDTVTFSIQGPPTAGGAYIAPVKALTNAAGRVATTVNSGTIAGVLQIIATLRRESDGVVVSSTPTRVVVNAGLPDQIHFSLGPQQFNFAAYNWIGRTDEIGVQVGDKYSNPVHQGTAVYFNTTGGVIAAAGYTDVTSHATVKLYSGNPQPHATLDPVTYPVAWVGDGTGYAWIYAQTIGENSVSVKDSILMLFSGIAGISVSPSYTINVLRGGSQTFDVNISDQFGNPLAPGTTISSSIDFTPPENTQWSAKIGGLPTDPFGDYMFRGSGTTNFHLQVIDATPGGTPNPMPVVVKITVNGPNGTATVYLYGAVGN